MLTVLQLDELARRLSKGLNDPTITTRIASDSTQIVKTYNAGVSSDVTSLGNSAIQAAKKSGFINNLDIKSGLVQNSQVETILQGNSADTIAIADARLIGIMQQSIPEYSQSQITSIIGTQVTDISATSVVNSIIDYTSNLFSGDALSSLFDGLGDTLSNVFEFISEQFDSGIASRAKQFASTYNINSLPNQSKLSNVHTGFSDPSATYPTQEYTDRPDTNKLATGELNGTIVVQKEKDRLQGSKLPGGGKWEMPTSSYNAKYPYNSVMQTESGHIVEFDDTPGSERINIHHKSGTYLEIDPNGTTVQRSKGSRYDITDKNQYISIGGTANVSIGSGLNIYINGDFNAEVAGNVAIRGNNDISINAGGRLQLSANEGIDIHSTDIFMESEKTTNILAGSKASIQAITEMHVKADSITTQTTKDISFKAGENFIWDSGKLTLGEQNSSKVATAAPHAKAGIGSPRIDFVKHDIPEPQSRNFLDEYATFVETPKDNYPLLRNALVNSGLIDIKILDKKPIIIKSNGGNYNGMEVSMPKTAATTETVLPDNYQMTTHFTLANVTTKAGLHHSALKAQAGLSYNQILSNLQLLCINILEPLYAVYPDLEIISAFNEINDYQVNSDHYTGNAVDIQFRDQNTKDYYDLAVAISKIIPYDTLTLNYSDYSNKPWIHISLKSEGNQGVTETWYNNKKITGNLSYLT